MHFIDNPKNLPVVDHINENKEDNRKENLRWCTLEENASFVNIRENRDLDLIKKEKEQLTEIKTYIESLYKEIQKERTEIEKQLVYLSKYRAGVLEEIESKFNALLKQSQAAIKKLKGEAKRALSNKADTIKKKYGSVDKLIKEIGIEVKVNNKVFPTIRSAARFIIEEELKLSIRRNIQTIRKEVKRIATGEVPSREMYNKYLVEPAV